MIRRVWRHKTGGHSESVSTHEGMKGCWITTTKYQPYIMFAGQEEIGRSETTVKEQRPFGFSLTWRSRMPRSLPSTRSAAWSSTWPWPIGNPQ